MKVILLNGSPRPNGNTYHALKLAADALNVQGIETEILQIGTKGVHGCIGCGSCATRENHLCVFTDDVLNEYAVKMRQADGFIIGSPVYYAAMAGDLKCFMDRAFYTSSSYFRFKPAAGVAVARRAGAVSTFNQIENYFALGEMLRVPTIYWGDGYGQTPGQVEQDAEGCQHMQVIARNMAWLLQVLQAGKDVPKPEKQTKIRTNFIR
ncbi:MAG: flavodoxin family protein [Oscillospiraceae bacterium]|nr:flavodoxin family protein [Oscillospiraceae bacterium]